MAPAAEEGVYFTVQEPLESLQEVTENFPGRLLFHITSPVGEVPRTAALQVAVFPTWTGDGEQDTANPTLTVTGGDDTDVPAESETRSSKLQSPHFASLPVDVENGPPDVQEAGLPRPVNPVPPGDLRVNWQV